jgi:hypothetical protein|tara:strand:- start:123 stop:344 length:222 start_codon:yes stop_codon:yes gene_type:complete
MNIDLLPIGFSGGILFWILFLILGLLMPFFVFINTYTLVRVLQELKKINNYYNLLEDRHRQKTLGQQPRIDGK